MANKFHFKQFSISQDRAAMKVNTDAMLLGSWIDVKNSKKILDIGTGTGCIALMIAQRSPSAQVVGIEIDHDSYLDALSNAESSIFQGRVSMLHESLQEFIHVCKEKFDHIVSNPPYFNEGSPSPNLSRANVRHEISLTLDELVAISKDLLIKGGYLSVIIPNSQYSRFHKIALSNEFYLVTKCEVWTNPSTIGRLLLTYCNRELTQKKPQTILIRNKNGKYSSQYKFLTKEFHHNSL